LLATENYDKSDPVNLGAGKEIKTEELVSLISELSGYEGRIIWDYSKPDRQPRRRLDTTKAKREFGFEAKTNFEEGLKRTIKWYVENRVVTRIRD
jgi:GDP-L-fucose synthase